MRAQVLHRYGDALTAGERPRPTPEEGELLVNVHAAGVNPLDWKVQHGSMRWLTGRDFPKVLGNDIAGTVADVGPGVDGFAPGDDVFAMLPTLQGGAFAEYAIVRSGGAAPRPASLSFTEAAAVPLAALTALQALRDEAGLGDRAAPSVVVNGATGGVGHFAVQIARAFGAEVTGVCSGRNAAFARALGCHRVLDYTEGRVGERLRADAPFDVFFDAAGQTSFRNVARLLTARGRYVTTLPSPSNLLFVVLTLPFPKKARLVNVSPRRDDLAYLAHLIDEGTLAPTVARVFPFDEAEAALQYGQKEHPAGKIVLRIRDAEGENRSAVGNTA